MLLVKTYIGKSRIHGVGLFADQFIPEGTVIWEFTPGIDVELSSLKLDNEIKEDFLNTYCYKNKGKYILCVDNARFINHSNNPNTDDSKGPCTIARKDIYPNEEIVSDYSEFGADEEDNKFNTGI
jgi:SET domain-containing protein